MTEDWDRRSVSERRMFWNGQQHGEVTRVPREKVCAVEIWVECLGQDPGKMKRADAVEINGILVNAPGWQRCKTAKRFGCYGVQKGFIRA